METAVKRMTEETGRAGLKASYAAGRKAAQKTYEKLSGRAAASAGRQVQAAKAAKQTAVKSMQRTAVRSNPFAALFGNEGGCSDGMTWFQGQGRWQAAGTTPTAGSIIFFDWDGDGKSDHVGIVEKCEGGRVYTVEGNSGDAVRRRDYDINYSCIMGYGRVN